MALSKKNVTESADANMEKILMLLTKHEENINNRLDLMERKIDGINMEILDKIKDLNKRVNDVEKAIDFYGKQYESQKKMSDNLLKSNTFLSEENKVLKTEINNLRADQEKQNCALNELQQHGRRECIEVSGVPPTDNEDSEEIIMAIAKEIGVTLENNEISACHRVKKAKGDPIIIAKFTNRKIKEEFMTKRRNLKHKSIGSLKLSNVDGKINGWGSQQELSNKSIINGTLRYSPAVDLQEIDVPIVTKAHCRKFHGKEVSDLVFCGGNYTKGTMTSCLGDSGSPLICRDGSEVKPFIAGIVIGSEYYCRTGSQYMMFTEVAKYITWIDSHLKKSVGTQAPTQNSTSNPNFTQNSTSKPNFDSNASKTQSYFSMIFLTVTLTGFLNIHCY